MKSNESLGTNLRGLHPLATDQQVRIFSPRPALTSRGLSLSQWFREATLQLYSMSSRLVPILTTLVFFWTSTVYSDPEPKSLGRSSPDKAKQPDSATADHDLVHRLVQIARDKYEVGKLAAADKILKAALEIEPRNNEAWYYSDLLQKTIQEHKNSKPICPWYPTIPPRPVNE